MFALVEWIDSGTQGGDPWMGNIVGPFETEDDAREFIRTSSKMFISLSMSALIKPDEYNTKEPK